MLKSISEYSNLAQMADVAEEALGTMRFGSHYALKLELSRHRIVTSSREGDIKAARKLCDEFMTAWKADE